MKKVIWITGYSGAGKTTLASALNLKLENSAIIDGDELRKERPNLGFDYQSRLSNVYHAAYKAMNTHKDYAIVSLISPGREMRLQARYLIERYSDASFIEVFLDIPLDVCESRDSKGLYKKARAGKIKDFTGIDSPYEPPIDPDIWLPYKSPYYGTLTVEKAVEIIINRC